jgi:hypothetical protein
MPWKIDETGVPVLDEGRPVLITSEGGELPVEADEIESATRKISELNAESAERRIRIRELGEALAAFDDFDPETVRSTLAEKERLQARVGELEAELAAREEALAEEAIAGRFAASDYIADKLAVPAEMLRALFGEHFRYEAGRVVGELEGETLMSPDNPEIPASFDEALAALVEAYPHKDHLLRGARSTGSGAPAVAAGAKAGNDPSRLHPTQRIAQART